MLAVGDVASSGDLPATASLSNPKETPRADPHVGCCGGRGRETAYSTAIRLSVTLVHLRRDLGKACEREAH